MPSAMLRPLVDCGESAVAFVVMIGSLFGTATIASGTAIFSETLLAFRGDAKAPPLVRDRLHVRLRPWESPSEGMSLHSKR